ncbi:MAG: hypothetical protein CML68_19080 [Rhodobacteraceae bacterium]|nr:hypothetical protein [Paracoccaceae bacterium]
MTPLHSGNDFTIFREYFDKKTGIGFDESKRYFVDKRILQRIQAAEGVFRSRSLQHVPARVKKRHFSEIAEGQFQISEDIREAVTLFQVNVANPDEARTLRGHDIVFCRNMLIYFDDRSRSLAVNALYAALNPGGFLFLGHSESTSRMSAMFTIRKFPDAIVYQRPLS